MKKKILISIILIFLSTICYATMIQQLKSVVAKRNSAGAGGETTLNTGNTYGQNTVLMYLFDDGEGSNVTDYSGNNNTGTVTGATWDSAGIQIDGTSERVTCNMPTMSGEGSIFIYFTTIGAAPQSYAVLLQSETGEELQIKRNGSDTELRVFIDTLNQEAWTVPDLWDNGTHTILIVWDDVANFREVFVDGTTAGSSATALVVSIADSTLWIGNDDATGRYANAIFHAVYFWSVEYTSTDATSLNSSPYQMFNNPPSR